MNFTWKKMRFQTPPSMCGSSGDGELEKQVDNPIGTLVIILWTSGGSLGGSSQQPAFKVWPRRARCQGGAFKDCF